MLVPKLSILNGRAITVKVHRYNPLMDIYDQQSRAVVSELELRNTSVLFSRFVAFQGQQEINSTADTRVLAIKYFRFLKRGSRPNEYFEYLDIRAVRVLLERFIRFADIVTRLVMVFARNDWFLS